MKDVRAASSEAGFANRFPNRIHPTSADVSRKEPATSVRRRREIGLEQTPSDTVRQLCSSFKTGGAGDPGPAGSIPVRLR